MKHSRLCLALVVVVVLFQAIASETINNGFHVPQCWTVFSQKLQYIDLTPLASQQGYSINPSTGNYTFNLNFCASAGQSCRGYNTWLIAKSKQTTTECINLAGDSLLQNFQIGQWFSKTNENIGTVLTYLDGELQNTKPRYSQIYIKCNNTIPTTASPTIVFWGQYEFPNNITYKFETESPHGCTKDIFTAQVIAILIGIALLAVVLCCCCLVISIACCAGCGYYCCFRRKDYHQLY